MVIMIEYVFLSPTQISDRLVMSVEMRKGWQYFLCFLYRNYCKFKIVVLNEE